MSITAFVYFLSSLNLCRGLNIDSTTGREMSHRSDLNYLKEEEKGEQVLLCKISLRFCAPGDFHPHNWLSASCKKGVPVPHKAKLVAKRHTENTSRAIQSGTAFFRSPLSSCRPYLHH